MTFMNIMNTVVHDEPQTHPLPTEHTNKQITPNFSGVHFAGTTYHDGQGGRRRQFPFPKEMSILPVQLTSVVWERWYSTALVFREIPYYIALISPVILSMLVPVLLSLFTMICTFSVVLSPVVFVLFALYFALCTSRPQLYYDSHSIRSRTIIERCKTLRER